MARRVKQAYTVAVTRDGKWWVEQVGDPLVEADADLDAFAGGGWHGFSSACSLHFKG